MYIKKLSFHILFFFINIVLVAQQSTDTLIYLPEVEIKDLKTFQATTDVELLDSTALSLYSSSDIADVLNQHSSIYIKSYGIGLATSSIRGAGANQSIVVWNGFSLQNPMLGLLDLSLLPVHFSDEVHITKGGNASLWGSSAIGAVIELENERSKEKGFSMEIGISSGSFELKNLNASVKYNDDQFSIVLKPFYQKAQNDFTYKVGEENKKLEHAALENYGLLTEIYYRFNSRNKFSYRNWYQYTDRLLPANLVASPSLEQQEDTANRSTFHWSHLNKNFEFNLRSAFFIESNYYENFALSIESLNQFKSIINELEVKSDFSKNHKFLLGINQTNIEANAEAYQQSRNENRLAVFLSYRYSMQKLDGGISLRQQFQNKSSIPLIPSFDLSYKLSNLLNVNARLNKVFNLPTLNDRYWIPGGNRSLKAENGWSKEVTLNIKDKVKAPFLNLSTTIYHRNIDDLIVWVPGNQYWSPVNFAETKSYGIESNLGIEKSIQEFKFNLDINYNYTTSRNGDGNQLMYIPLHQAGFRLAAKLKQFEVNYNHRMIGTVYTRTDNSDEIESYNIGNLKMNYLLKISSLKANLFLDLNNIWNASYQVIESRPMPGINFEAGMKLILK